MSILRSDRPVTAATKVLPSAVCDAVIAEAQADAQPIGMDRAKGAVARLLRCYPSIALKQRTPAEAKDFDAYTKALTEVFARYGEPDCVAVTDPVNGLPGRNTFPPNVAELTVALNDLAYARNRVVFNAKAHKAEAERRAHEAAEEAARPPVDKAAVDALVASLRASSQELTG